MNMNDLVVFSGVKFKLLTDSDIIHEGDICCIITYPNKKEYLNLIGDVNENSIGVNRTPLDTNQDTFIKKTLTDLGFSEKTLLFYRSYFVTSDELTNNNIPKNQNVNRLTPKNEDVNRSSLSQQSNTNTIPYESPLKSVIEKLKKIPVKIKKLKLSTKPQSKNK